MCACVSVQLYMRVQEDGFCAFPDGSLRPRPEALKSGLGLVPGVNNVRFEIRWDHLRIELHRLDVTPDAPCSPWLALARTRLVQVHLGFVFSSFCGRGVRAVMQ